MKAHLHVSTHELKICKRSVQIFFRGVVTAGLRKKAINWKLITTANSKSFAVESQY